MEQIISAGLEELGLTGRVPKDAPALLAQYGQMLLEKNQVMNLTAIRDPEGVARLHMLDCAALLKYCDLAGKTLIDVGTGAGFPGMVLKILVPSLEVTLLDSLNKRLDWLLETSGALSAGLYGNVRTIHARAEEQALVKGYRDSFDFAAARAVADLRLLCELCLPFVKVGGSFLAMKSAGSDPELGSAAHQAPGGPDSRCGGLQDPGHRGGPPADRHRKGGPHSEGLPPTLGQDAKRASLTSNFQKND